jgi:hypothetical protein
MEMELINDAICWDQQKIREEVIIVERYRLRWVEDKGKGHECDAATGDMAKSEWRTPVSSAFPARTHSAGTHVSLMREGHGGNFY